MTVDILSSIKGAEPSESVNQLFEVIKNANTSDTNVNTNHNNAVTLDDLREDVVIDSPQAEKQIIIENFPKEKNGFLVVSKVIEESGTRKIRFIKIEHTQYCQFTFRYIGARISC